MLKNYHKVFVSVILFAIVLSTNVFATDIFDEKVSVDMLMVSLKPMSEYLFRHKYPNLNLNQIVAFSDSAGKLFIVIRHMQEPVSQDSIEKIRDKMQRQYTKLGVAEQCKIKEINGRKFITLEFMSKAIDTNIFNLIFATDLEGRLLFATYNCTSDKMSQGVDIGYQILHFV